MCLRTYIASLPVAAQNASELDLQLFTNAIIGIARKNLASNQTVIPALQTLDVILDAGILGKLANIASGAEAYVQAWLILVIPITHSPRSIQPPSSS